MLELPIARAALFVLVRPHYPENVGAVARAMKVMGFRRLVLVKPGRIAVPEHEMARKMAVKSTDVLEAAERKSSLEEALEGCAWAFATTARRGVSGIVTPHHAAQQAVLAAARAVLEADAEQLVGEDLSRLGQVERGLIGGDRNPDRLGAERSILW